MSQKIVESKVYTLKELFADKFEVDFYQREYVWQRKQLEDLIDDLTTEFLKNWSPEHELKNVKDYDPYFMGEVVLSLQEGKNNSIIDGQQRITTFTLLLIYLLKTFGNLDGFPKDVGNLIYSDDFGTPKFNLDIPEREVAMLSLFKNGDYELKEDDNVSVHNIVDRYHDFFECWDDRINESNAVYFVYWLKEKVVFSKVWTNSDDFAYVIFETMNDRGLSLTQIEMLRSYLLANINLDERQEAMDKFDSIVKSLVNIKLSSKSKAEFEFFKMYFRGHFAEDLSQNKESNSDFTRIGKEFHRWLRDNSQKLGLENSKSFVEFINKIEYFANVYIKINKIISEKDTSNYLYLIVNSDYNFTLQPALLLSAIAYNDNDEIIEKKLKVVSKYLTKVLSWRIWNHYVISQSALEAPIYELCKKIREKDITEIETILSNDPIGNGLELENSPTLNQQNKSKIKVLLALITEIVAQESQVPNYILKDKDIEVEHIWANHFEQHTDEFTDKDEFANYRNNIGDLLVLPKSFNASYGDAPFSDKVVHYYSQNILARTLNVNQYENNPGFVNFKNSSGLPFKNYEIFNKAAINERAELYKQILKWNWE